MEKNILSNKILKTGSLSLLGTILVKAVNLISIPVFSRLLTTSEYGQVDVCQYIYDHYGSGFYWCCGQGTTGS